MTISDAARRLRVSRQRVMELIDEGRIGQRTPKGRVVVLALLEKWEHSEARLKYRGLLPVTQLGLGALAYRRKHGQRAKQISRVSQFVAESERIREDGPRRRGRRTHLRAKEDLPEQKNCARCSRLLPAEQFYLSFSRKKSQGWRLSAWCKACARKNDQMSKRRNRDEKGILTPRRRV